jgi:hypothetical protein
MFSDAGFSDVSIDEESVRGWLFAAGTKPR